MFFGNWKSIFRKYRRWEETWILCSGFFFLGNAPGLDIQILTGYGKDMEVNNMCTALEKLKEDGKMEGLQEGLQKGRQKGLQEGLQEGKREGMQEKEKAVILVMLKNNYPISEICKISGATEETVLEIKESTK